MVIDGVIWAHSMLLSPKMQFRKRFVQGMTEHFAGKAWWCHSNSGTLSLEENVVSPKERYLLRISKFKNRNDSSLIGRFIHLYVHYSIEAQGTIWIWYLLVYTYSNTHFLSTHSFIKGCIFILPSATLDVISSHLFQLFPAASTINGTRSPVKADPGSLGAILIFSWVLFLDQQSLTWEQQMCVCWGTANGVLYTTHSLLQCEIEAFLTRLEIGSLRPPIHLISCSFVSLLISAWPWTWAISPLSAHFSFGPVFF